MISRIFLVALAASAIATSASSQGVTVVDCNDPANEGVAECAPAELAVPSLATNAAPLIALPVGALLLGGLGGGGGSTDGTNGTTGTTSTTGTTNN
ncbi:hypothetical protein [Vannielia litorea]|uniref:hypothetical protein n=1 Tax=Vannielia litorea TaxID=1217970 RepID=UPI001BCEB321|nr:hypothetical protein [Vannielia litorea]MBS8227418.1 hypothetical protein [Vannielia litorea]